MRTTKAAKSFLVKGRPGFRLALPSYFCAISLQCQASRVSGVTRVTTSARSLRPKPLARTAKRRRWSSVNRKRRSELFAQDSVLFAQILDYILLPLIDPTGQHDHNELKGIEHRLRHLVIVSSRLQSIASVLFIRVFGPYGMDICSLA